MINRRAALSGAGAGLLAAGLWRPGRAGATAATETLALHPAPVTDGDVLALHVLHLDVPYLAIGGRFTTVTTVDGVVHLAHNLAVVNLGNGRLVHAGDTDGYVYALGGVNSTLYVGGRFTHVDGQLRNRIAALSTNDWSVKPWTANPAVTSGIVTAIAYSDTLLFLGSSNAVAAYRQSTGARLWQDTTTEGPVRCLLAWHGTPWLYVGGLFKTLRGSWGEHRQNALAAVRMSDGLPNTAFRPVLRPNSGTVAPASYDGQNIISCGANTVTGELVGGIASAHDNGLTALDMLTGAAHWYTVTPGDCQALLVRPGYVLGGWHNSNPAAHNPLYYAGIWRPGSPGGWDSWSGPDGHNVPSDDQGNGGVQAMAEADGVAYLGGAFTLPRPSLVAYA